MMIESSPASTWNRPTSTATVQVTWALGGRLAASHSAASIHTPPSTRAQATGVMRSGSLKPSLLTARPSAAVMRKASISLAA